MLTDQEVVKALKSLRRMLLGEDTIRDYTLLPFSRWMNGGKVSCPRSRPT